MTSVDEPVAEVDETDGARPPHVRGASGESAPAWRRFGARWGAELGVVAGTAAVYAWGLGQNGLGNPYYAASVRSMNTSLRNFAFASFDPGGWVTVDKPPLSQWLAALSVWVFGWSTWSLLLPSLLCGVASVGLLMVTVRRAWGRTAGVAAGIALSATPAVLAVSRNNNPDAALMLCCVAAAWAVQRALGDGHRASGGRPGDAGLLGEGGSGDGRVAGEDRSSPAAETAQQSSAPYRWMVVAGACGGLGFLTKSLAVGAVLPGLWLAYLVAAGAPLRRRFLHALVGGVAFVAVAGAWIVAVQLTPLSSRPWIGGSSDGTAWDLVVGYNGFGRVTGSGGPMGSMPDMSDMPDGGGPSGFMTGPDGVDEFGGPTGIGRLFNAGMGDQAMWLSPLALAAGVGGLVVAFRARRRDARLGSLVTWLAWGGLTYVTFAFAEGIFHNYYVSLLGPAVAALVGIGVQLVREASWVGRVFAALALAATVPVQLVLLGRVDAWEVLRWLVPVGVAVAAAVVLAALLVSWRRQSDPPDPGSRRLALNALTLGVAMLGLAPALWSLAGVHEVSSPLFPDARPVSDESAASGAGPFGGFEDGMALPDDMVRWLRQQHDGEKWIVAVGAAMQAQESIVEGDPVVALGGFMGMDGANSVDRVAAAVERRDLRFVLTSGGFPGSGGGSSAAVVAACTAVDPAVWSPSPDAATTPTEPAGDLYDCAGKADTIRANADAAPDEGQGGFPGGMPDLPEGVEMEDMFEAGRCIMEHGGDPFELATGEPPSSATQEAIEACEDVIPPGGLTRPDAAG
jgi:4-amino-4-deoxy-L-arabinose transferase-like glycosyltransferase